MGRTTSRAELSHSQTKEEPFVLPDRQTTLTVSRLLIHSVGTEGMSARSPALDLPDLTTWRSSLATFNRLVKALEGEGDR